MSTIETAVAEISAEKGWKISGVVVVDPDRRIWMGNVMTTRMADAGAPERTFAIHVVDGKVSDGVHAETIDGLKDVLAERERGRFAA